MPDTDPAKRVPTSLTADTALFGPYTLPDLAVAALPGVLVVVTGQVLLPRSASIAGHDAQAMLLPLAGAAMAVGLLFVSLTPSYVTSLEWLAAVVRFASTPDRSGHDAAKRHTRIERLYPRRNALGRTDGALIGLLQVTPPPMALATDDDWAAAATSFQEFLNTTVEFPIQLYSTTQAFPVDEYVAHYEDRLTDRDVEANPHLATLIERYVDWCETELRQRRMTIREHYVVVEVTPTEGRYDRDGITRRLAAVPGLGLAVRAVTAPPVAAERAAMFEALDERLRRVERGLRDIEGCDARRLDVAEALALISEFWAGASREYQDPDRVLRTRPLVASRRAE